MTLLATMVVVVLVVAVIVATPLAFALYWSVSCRGDHDYVLIERETPGWTGFREIHECQRCGQTAVRTYQYHPTDDVVDIEQREVPRETVDVEEGSA